MNTTTLSSSALYRRSVLMIIIGGACLSLLGIGMRLMENADSLQIIFYRGITQAGFLALILLWRYRDKPARPYHELGPLGVLAAIMIAAAGLFLVLAVFHTSVANALFIVSLAPLCSALLGKLILDEHVKQRTWVAIAIAVIGIAIIFGAGISGGGLLGMSFAFLMVLFYSGSLVTIRSQSGADMIAVCALSGVLLASGVAPFIQDFTVSLNDLLLCVALGVFQLSFGMVLLTKGAEHVPAAQVSLLALLEVVLGPIWVWVGVNEVPTIYSLVGGTVVLLGVIMQALDQK